jgi:hypothetical protein
MSTEARMADPDSEFDLYRAEILAALGDRDALEVLTETLTEIAEVTSGATAEQLDRSPGPGEWSPTQVLHHLADNDLVTGVRVRMIVTDDRPQLVPYNQDVWTARFADLEDDPRATLHRWEALRENNLRVWRSLNEAEWLRTGLHPVRGEQSVRDIVMLLAGHDIVHIDQLRRGIAAAADSRIA